MPNLNISFSVNRAMGLLKPHAIGSESIRWLVAALSALGSGDGSGGSSGLIWSVNDDTALGDTAFAGPATGALVLSGGAGAVGATIDGTLVTAAFTTSDVVTQGLVAAAIRANTSVNRKVTATNRGMQLTLASVTAGQFIDICGQRFTAVNGAPTDFGQFDMSGADAADATSLALGINRHPQLSMKFRATSNGAIVYIHPTVDRAASRFESLTNPGGFSTFTLANSGLQANLAICAIMAMVPGDIGECCTVVASGTGMTYATANAGKLGNGTGGGTTSNYLLP
jgi:hypothetical protein